jgi:hypothetical protein
MKPESMQRLAKKEMPVLEFNYFSHEMKFLDSVTGRF